MLPLLRRFAPTRSRLANEGFCGIVSFKIIFKLAFQFIAMRNPCYEVYKNGELLCKAGLDSEFGVLNTILTWVKRKDGSESLDLDVSGLDSVDNKSLRWVKESLASGDEISIKITENTEYTESTARPPFDKERYREDQIKHYYRLKEELKDYLKEEDES